MRRFAPPKWSSLRVRFTLLAGLFLITPVLTVLFGAATVSIADVVAVVASHIPGTGVDAPSPIAEAVIWDNRAPRVVSGLGIGAILAVSGTALQAVTRNALAEPYILGVSSGASFGAAVAVVFLGVSGGSAVSTTAFLGAVAATFLVLAIGGRRNQTILHLVLAGLAAGFIFHSLTNLVIFSSDDPETARSVMFWMLGSLSRCTWESALSLVVTAIVLTLLFWFIAPWLDAISTGDNTALTIGIDPVRLRVLVTVVVSFAVAMAVAAAGGIGFVGLIVPHLSRRRLAHRHRLLVPGTALVGASFLAWADTLARVTFAPAEIPIGVVTGIVGAPILLFMVRGMAARA